MKIEFFNNLSLLQELWEWTFNIKYALKIQELEIIIKHFSPSILIFTNIIPELRALKEFKITMEDSEKKDELNYLLEKIEHIKLQKITLDAKYFSEENFKFLRYVPKVVIKGLEFDSRNTIQIDKPIVQGNVSNKQIEYVDM
jgi:hypothetical protein